MSFGVIKYGMPAERRRGLVWQDNFESPELVAKNRGTVVESAPGNVKIDFGATYPGVNGNGINYPCGSLLNKPAINFLFDFIPNIAADNGAAYYLFSTLADQYAIYKSAGNTLSIILGTTFVGGAVIGTYLPYWRINQRNLLAVCCIGGNNRMDLNGITIMSNANAWTPTDRTTMYWGSDAASNTTIPWRIFSAKIFTGQTSADLLTLQESADYFNQRVF